MLGAQEKSPSAKAKGLGISKLPLPDRTIIELFV